MKFKMSDIHDIHMVTFCIKL